MTFRVPRIRTDRLDLVSIPPSALRDLLADRARAVESRLGIELPPDLAQRARRLIEIRLGDVEGDPGARPWLLRFVVLWKPEGSGRGQPVVGLIGFHGPPDASGRVEVGYEIFEPFRRRGYATEAVRALLGWASVRGARRFVASIGPGNAPSLAIARKLGFEQTGSQIDEEDGLELVFELAGEG